MSVRRFFWLGRWGAALLFLWIGIAAGTAAGNWETIEKRWNFTKNQEIQESSEHIFADMGIWIEGSSWRRQPGTKEKFFYLCRKRLSEGSLGWLVGMTVCAKFCFCLGLSYAGFLIGLIVSVYTVELGILGLPWFFLSCFPQMICYLPAWGILIWRAMEGEGKVHLPSSLFAALLFCAGAGLEAFANPFFLSVRW